MSEKLFFDEDKANLYERQAYDPNTPSSIEEAFVRCHGGEPVEWTPEATVIMDRIIDAIASGSSVAMVSGYPETSGMFAGYHEVKIPLIDVTDDAVSLMLRTVYATPDQVATGCLHPPQEGLFCIDEIKEHQ